MRTLLFYDFNILENADVSNSCSEMTSFNRNMYSVNWCQPQGFQKHSGELHGSLDKLLQQFSFSSPKINLIHPKQTSAYIRSNGYIVISNWSGSKKFKVVIKLEHILVLCFRTTLMKRFHPLQMLTTIHILDC